MREVEWMIEESSVAKLTERINVGEGVTNDLEVSDDVVYLQCDTGCFLDGVLRQLGSGGAGLDLFCTLLEVRTPRLVDESGIFVPKVEHLLHV